MFPVYPKNVIFIFLIFVSSFLGSIFILLPLIPVFFLKHDLWRYLVDRIVGFWILFPVALLEYFVGIQFSVSGDRIKREDKAILIMNHRTRLDWLFFWNALCKIDPFLVTSEKISLKAGLKRIPGAGWAMECNVFMFLDRAWETDEQLMTDLCFYYGWTKKPYQILIFPEGTDYCARSIDKSKTFSEQHNLPNHDFVLQPRTTGFAHMVTELVKNDALDYVYDVTIGYPDSIVQTEYDFGLGRACPRTVDFNIRRYRLRDEIPVVTNDTLTQWCRQKWNDKDALLKTFYEETDIANRRFVGQPVIARGESNRPTSVLMIALMFWILSVCVWIYLTLTSYFVLFYVAFGTVFFVSIQYFYGGIEKLSVACVKQ